MDVPARVTQPQSAHHQTVMSAGYHWARCLDHRVNQGETGMLIIDVMRRLNTEHEIGFLLTAYIETLQFYDPAKRLPQAVAELPLRGAEDIEARLTALLHAKSCAFAPAPGATQGKIAREATDVFAAAHTRLQALRSTPRALPTRAAQGQFPL
jgi:hypothetical protein